MSNEVTKKLQNLRIQYSQSSLDFKDCSLDPFVQMNLWLDQAINSEVDEPNAFVLSTCKNNKPRSRVVLLKGLIGNKFYFYTNYKSSKGEELSQNGNVSMTFLWLPLQRQVRVEGVIRLATEAESDDYFKKRPRGSQLGALASPQSTKVKDRETLESLFKETEESFKGKENIPRPAHWGGYVIVPEYFEFWQGRDNRMHDRIVYELSSGEWSLSRLAP